MKKVKAIIFAALLTLSAFSILFYISCTKNKCSGLTCYNGGSCSGGQCICATGFTGNHCELSYIVYQNNTFTAVDITINGTKVTMPRSNSAVFTGTPGTSATGSATTRGLFGSTYNWTFNDLFPSNGNTFTNTLNVSSEYFFLEIANNDIYPINNLLINSGTATQTSEAVSLVPERLPYYVGYYKSAPNTTITVKLNTNTTFTTDSITLPDTANAMYLLTIL